MIWNDFVIRSRRLDALVVSRNYKVVCTFYRTKMNVNLCTGLTIVFFLLKILVAILFKFSIFYLVLQKLFQVLRSALKQNNCFCFCLGFFCPVQISFRHNQNVGKEFISNFVVIKSCKKHANVYHVLHESRCA